MKLGLALPHYDFSFPDTEPATVERVVGVARRAEDLGFESVWVSDHLFLDLAKYGGPGRRFGTPEAFTTLGAVAAATRRVRLGTLVACAAFRSPAVTAAIARTLHDASGGRFELGLGAGWYEAEFREAGIPFGTAGRRLRHLEEVLRAVRASLPPEVPVFVGGKGGPKVLGIVARAADGWNVVWRVTPEDYRARVNALREACAAAGRDPATVRLSVGLSCLVGTDEADLARRFEALRAWAPGGALEGWDLARYAEGALVGTPEVCALRIKELESLGVERIIVALANLPFAIYDEEQLEVVARALLPPVG